MTSVVNRRSSGKTGPFTASFFFLLSFATAALLLAGCGESEPGAFSYSGPIMGTSYHVKVVAKESDIPDNLGDQVHDVLAEVDRRMSTYKPDSELNQLNRAPVGQGFKVSQELMDVLVISRSVYEKTGGAFDPTVGPLVDLWGFGPSYHEDQVPDETVIAKLMDEVGFDSLSIDESSATVTKTKPVSLDLSAVAKGYSADRVGDLLKGLGITRYMVEVGGEMVVSGHNDRDVPWQIAIEKPDSHTRAVQQIISVTNEGIATSGDYRNFFEKNGVRYSHTIDPRTGHPIAHKLASVTVVTETCGLSDALATSFMVMGTEHTLAFAEKENIAVFTLSKTDNGFEAAHSSAFNRYLKEVK